MRTYQLGQLAIVLSLVFAACDSWSGSDDPGKAVSSGRNPASSGDGGAAHHDAGMHAVKHDAGPREDGGLDGGRAVDGGGAVDDGGKADGGVEPALGDDRAGFVQCGGESCSSESQCCTTQGDDEALSKCASACGGTEASVVCDGPEDCSKGQVCCHRFGAPGMLTECITVGPGDDDAGTAPVTCDSDEEWERHVACHTDEDCQGVSGRPLCRADSARRGYLGYCSEATDRPETKGHDDKGMVGCGDPDHDGTGAACVVGSQLCCVSWKHPSVAACGKADLCGFSEVSVVCDGPEDCHGSMCCYVAHSESDAGVRAARSVCADDCAKLDADAVTRCHTDEDCGTGGTCESDQSSPWWGVCKR